MTKFKNEREFQKAIVVMAQQYSWRYWHLPTPMRPIGGNKFVPDPRGKGFPDLVLIHEAPPRIIFAEVKDEKNVVSEEQREFLRLARGVSRISSAIVDFDSGGIPNQYRPIGVFVWRPANWDLIEATLKGAHL